MAVFHRTLCILQYPLEAGIHGTANYLQSSCLTFWSSEIFNLGALRNTKNQCVCRRLKKCTVGTAGRIQLLSLCQQAQIQQAVPEHVSSAGPRGVGVGGYSVLSFKSSAPIFYQSVMAIPDQQYCMRACTLARLHHQRDLTIILAASAWEGRALEIYECRNPCFPGCGAKSKVFLFLGGRLW